LNRGRRARSKRSRAIVTASRRLAVKHERDRSVSTSLSCSTPRNSSGSPERSRRAPFNDGCDPGQPQGTRRERGGPRAPLPRERDDRRIECRRVPFARQQLKRPPHRWAERAWWRPPCWVRQIPQTWASVIVRPGASSCLARQPCRAHAGRHRYEQRHLEHGFTPGQATTVLAQILRAIRAPARRQRPSTDPVRSTQLPPPFNAERREHGSPHTGELQSRTAIGT
jgi:hypothetical protein